MDLRSHIAAVEDRARKIVSVPEWGCELELLELTGQQRDRIMQMFLDARVPDPANPGGEKQGIPQYHREWYVIYSAHDPETHKPVFTEADLQLLSEKSERVLNRLCDEIQALSALDGDALEDALGKSPASLNGSTGTEPRQPSDAP